MVLVDVDGFVNKCSSYWKQEQDLLYCSLQHRLRVWLPVDPSGPPHAQHLEAGQHVQLGGQQHHQHLQHPRAKDRVLHIRGARTGSFTSEGQGQGPSHQGVKDRVLHIRMRGGQGRVALSASSLLPCCCLWPGCKSVLLLKHNNTFISDTIILLLLLLYTDCVCCVSSIWIFS